MKDEPRRGEDFNPADLLVEFCRTGNLGPLRLGMTAAQVEGLLGGPDTSRWLHGDPNWQRYRYGSISLTFMAKVAEVPTKEELGLARIRVSLHTRPVELPPHLTSTPVLEWPQAAVSDVLRVLQLAGVDVSLQAEDVSNGEVYQRFRAGTGGAHITAFDHTVEDIEVE